MEKKGIYKFRVTRMSQREWKDGPEMVEQLFRTYARAKRFYKNYLLTFHRDRNVCEWRICLNRPKDARWKNPLHEDSTYSSRRDFSEKAAMVG